MSSSAPTSPQHLYYYIEQGSPERFGQELTAALNRIRERDGDVLHIATQIIAGPDGAARVWTGQVVFSVTAGLDAFGPGQHDDRRQLDPIAELFITWDGAAQKPVSR